jgi:hypothetical protein
MGDEVQEALLQGPAALQELSGGCASASRKLQPSATRRTWQLIVIPPTKVLKAARA